ncbi:MAG: hypothetical protein LBN23_04315, partial [Paludibacter sp.]|nr:hypothetical protein [Paludibacter sp.]
MKNLMNKGNLLNVIFIIVISTLLFSCIEDNEEEDELSNNLQIGFIAPINNSDPFIFTDSEENSLIAFYKNQHTGTIQQALFHRDEKSLIMIYGTNGLPIGMYTDEYYFLFSNYNGNSVDISIYNENKELFSNETIENEDIFNLIQKTGSLSIRSNSSLRSNSSDDEFFNEWDRQFLKVSSLGISAFMCFYKPNPIACTSTAIDNINYFLESVYPEHYDKNSYLSKAGE